MNEKLLTMSCLFTVPTNIFSYKSDYIYSQHLFFNESYLLNLEIFGSGELSNEMRYIPMVKMYVFSNDKSGELSNEMRYIPMVKMYVFSKAKIWF